MHNFLEGVLQYHLRVLWGIGRTKAALKILEKLDQLDKASDMETSTTASSISDHDAADVMDVDMGLSFSDGMSTPTQSPQKTQSPLPPFEDDEDDDTP
ncbi:hypothetical protein H0H93_005318, partial [Arthromyces matolae]